MQSLRTYLGALPGEGMYSDTRVRVDLQQYEWLRESPGWLSCLFVTQEGEVGGCRDS